MNTKSRIASIMNACHLDESVTGIEAFQLSELKLTEDQEFSLPTNLRLGHLAEKVVSKCIKSSTHYKLLHENVQLIKEKRTIGEIDFIIEKQETREIIHLELAYKFYLYDPSISSDQNNCWIGPNRNDSLQEKLEKLKRKQFPLLYHECAASALDHIEISRVSQALCFLVSLFIPYEYKEKLSPAFQKAIKGYYVDMESFMSFNHTAKSYYLPSKTEWGIDPSDHDAWTDMKEIEKQLRISMEEKQSRLCWQKDGELHAALFILWW